ncbi:uncharacterized protein LOC134819765 [Bolinopsis microptera]|uniref:uncharacterized protein LOC134819765 n=1 Tax=Bolinopsis microptera TaxID=2820187 RepID=UPI0030791B4A
MNISTTEAETYIGLDPYHNDSALFTKCRDLRWRHSADMMVGVFYLVISIVGISENLYVFYQMVQTVKFRINQARCSFFIFVGNLAIGDILILTLPIWFTIHGLFNDRTITKEPGDALIVMTVFIHSCCARSSIIFVMFIAVFRVISVKYPLHISKVFSIVRSIIVAFLSWVLVVVLSIYSFDGTTKNALYSRSSALCMVMLREKDNESMSVAGQILAPFLVPGILTFLALIYLLIFLLRVYNRKMTKLRNNDSSYRPARERDSLIMTVKLTVCFVAFYTPWYIDGILEFNNTSSDRAQKTTMFKIHNTLTYTTCFGGYFWHNLCLGGFLFIGSAANPFLYGRTLVHTSQQLVHRGLVQTLYTVVTVHYRRLRGVVEDEDDLEQQGVEVISSANNSQIMLQQRSKSQRHHPQHHTQHHAQHLPQHHPQPYPQPYPQHHPQQAYSEKDSTESQELSKHSLLSDHQSGSTAQLVAKSETKKKELSRRSLKSSAHRVEHRERTDKTTKVRVKYSSTREKRV